VAGQRSPAVGQTENSRWELCSSLFPTQVWRKNRKNRTGCGDLGPLGYFPDYVVDDETEVRTNNWDENKKIKNKIETIEQLQPQIGLIHLLIGPQLRNCKSQNEDSANRNPQRVFIQFKTEPPSWVTQLHVDPPVGLRGSVGTF